MKIKLNILKNPLPAVLGIAMIVAFSCTKISYSSYYSNVPAEKALIFKPVMDKMLAKGMDSSFVFQLVASPRTEFNEKYVKINVTGFLSKADYTQFYDEKSIAKTKDFIEAHKSSLQAAEDKYKIPKSAIASILWIETRHGSYLGSNHIPSVYLSTALCNQDEYIELNINAMDANFSGTKDEREKLVEKIKARSKKKANWALGELVSLEKISRKMPIPVDSLYGSWAGAFGISQFLPSSYKAWAVDGNSDGVVDLFNFDDAIFSVANYLRINGWGESDSLQRKAVFHYNNSKAYVDAVLKLAELSR